MRRGLVLIVVIWTMFLIIGLTLIVIQMMRQEIVIVEHKRARLRAYYAAKAGMVHALEQLRKGEALDGNINLDGIPVNITYDAATGRLDISTPY